MSAAAKLAALGVRIERIAVRPEEIKSRFVRLARPLLKRWATAPDLSIKVISALVAEPTPKALNDAIRELSRNVTAVERMILIQGLVPTAHASWLRRLYEIVMRAARAISEQQPIREVDATAMLPPISVRKGDQPAVVLQLASIDHLLQSAREEREVIAHRRRMLEAARQLLLDVSAALPVEKKSVDQRLENIADQIAWIDRLEAAGVNAHVGLTHQARTALARNERDRLFATLSAIDRFAAIQNDVDFAAKTAAMLDHFTAATRAASLEQSAREIFGERTVQAIDRGFARARELHARGKLGDQQWNEYVGAMLEPGAEHAMLHSAISVDGSFEVGGVLSPARISEAVRTIQVVQHPAKEMALVPARGPEDLPHAIVDDPRMLVLQLAAGRLLARRWVEEKIEHKKRTVMRGEVRIYILDGSTSMLGPRARMRDAILIAELSTLARRLMVSRIETRVVLYYRYFTDQLYAIHKIETAQRAFEHIDACASAVYMGSTDIEQALLVSMEQIAVAKEEDPTLARAQIVLVTDGEAPVDPQRLQVARKAVGELPVGISVIALGQENPALRAIVAEQRRAGERAFYHHLDDQRLAEVTSRKNQGPSIHLPPIAGESDLLPLEQTLGEAIDELAALKRARDLDAGKSATEGARAKHEAAIGDHYSLSRRFLRWFPDPQKREPDRAPFPETGTIERTDLETMLVLLSTIAEVLRLIEGSALVRQADAVDLIERMLPDARLSPARWDLVVRCWPASLREALVAVHDAVKRGAYAVGRA